MADSPRSPEFLTLEDSAAVDQALLAREGKFLARLTISSLGLLKHISQDIGVAMEDLRTEQIIGWFEKDAKIRVEQGADAAFLKW